MRGIEYLNLETAFMLWQGLAKALHTEQLKKAFFLKL